MPGTFDNTSPGTPIGGHVAHADLEQIVEAAGDHVTFLDLRDAEHRLAELFERVLGRAVDPDFDEHQKTEIEPLGVEIGRVAGDDSGRFQCANPFRARRRAQTDGLRQRDVGEPPVALQRVENRDVDGVRFFEVRSLRTGSQVPVGNLHGD